MESENRISVSDWCAFDVDLSNGHMLANNRAWTNGCGVMFACNTVLMLRYQKWESPEVIETRKSAMEGPLTLENAKRLSAGATVYHLEKRNRDGSAMRAKVTSVKTWKRSPNRVELHVKHGMYDFAVFDETDIHLLTLVKPDPVKASRK